MSQAPRLMSVQRTPSETLESMGAGGKAVGLARLCEWGLTVPEAYVLVGATTGATPTLPELDADFVQGPLAIRSSSVAEDGVLQSFAGQYDSFLNVSGPGAVMEAIDRCLLSANNSRSAAYRGTDGEDNATDRMAVVLQQMVDATAAGVVFTADPTTGRRDRVVVDAVKGYGEALVSGHVTPHHLLTTLSGEVVFEECPEDGPALDASLLETLVSQAMSAADSFEAPLDLEWAVDGSGTLYWLQARPITTLPNPLDTDDTADVTPSDVYTRCNIGEMMPGAVTPLTASVTMRGIDYGIQAMQVAVGVRPGIETKPVFTAQFSGHLFLNLSAFGPMIRGVAGSNAERLCRAICGRPVPELDTGKPLSAWRRMLHGLRYGFYLLSAERHRRALQRDADALIVPSGPSSEALYDWIDRNLKTLYEAYDHHMASSAVAGALVPALLEVLAGGREPSAEHERRCAELLAAGDGEGVESLDIAAGMQLLGQAVAEDKEASEVLLSGDTRTVSAWLDAYQGRAGSAWRDYVRRHGHRAVRELELRQAEWAHDMTPLVDNLRLAVQAASIGKSARATPAVSKKGAWIEHFLAKKARVAAVGRERTKSLLVLVTTAFKVAYRRLGAQLAASGRLAQADDVFFFSHEELGQVLRSAGPWHDVAERRRVVLRYQSRLTFDEVFQGHGTPLDPQPMGAFEGDGLRGKPVSAGVVRGTARVVRSLDDLGSVKAGEILIAPVVDVGWTPCFPLIGGLVTEVGSAVSHGCVVAREFGLPALVGVSGATALISSGQLIELDANHGVITFVED